MDPVRAEISYSDIETLNDEKYPSIQNLLVSCEEDDEPSLQNSSTIDFTFLKAYPNLRSLVFCGSFGRTVTLRLEGIENCRCLESVEILTRMVNVTSLNGLEFCTELKKLEIGLGRNAPSTDSIDISAILELSNLETLQLDSSLALQPSLTHLNLSSLFPHLTILKLACNERDLSFLRGTELTDLCLAGPLESLDGLDAEHIQFLSIRGHKQLSVKLLSNAKNLERVSFDWLQVIDKSELDYLNATI